MIRQRLLELRARKGEAAVLTSPQFRFAGHQRLVVVGGLSQIALTIIGALLLAKLISDCFTGEFKGAAGNAALLLAVWAAREIIAGFSELMGRIAGLRAVAAVRRRLVEVTFESAQSGTTRPGQLIAAAVHGSEAISAYAGRYLPQRVIGALAPPLVIVVVFLVDPISGALLVISLPIAIVFLALVGIRAASAARRQNASMKLLDGHLLDVLRGLRDLKAHRREDFQLLQIKRSGADHRRATLAVLREAFLSALVLEFVAMLGTALVAVICGVRLAGGSMELEPALGALILAPEVFLPIRNLGREFHAGAEAKPIFEELAAGEVQTSLVPAGKPGAGCPDPSQQPIELEAVKISAGTGERELLGSLDLTVEPGQIIGLVGPSGSGKTSLLRVIAGLREPSSGQVSCAGTPLSEIDLSQWRGQVAWIAQQPLLLPASLRENLLFGANHGADSAANDAALEQALEQVGLGGLLRALPFGLETRLGDGALPLSAGELRRLAIARALLQKPSLVLADEPTANLDDAAATLIVGALASLCEGRTAVIATHDPRPLRISHKVVELGEADPLASRWKQPSREAVV